MAKKIKVNIKTDGTLEGTSLMVNGSDITKTQTVTRIYFSAYSPEPGRDFPRDEIYLSWDVVEENDDGVTKTVGYRLDVDGKKIYKGIGKKIGDSAAIQFETTEDRNSYNITQKMKELGDVIEIVNLEEKGK